ncbi:DUF397 domain-containing protein [Kitasatospora terrestris]|uniref:DUF397 domain-containing protein n=1 Tax=Kitasatospora terrestris TaxID=258051 RepID=A0ABP9DBR4_9ACTN
MTQTEVFAVSGSTPAPKAKGLNLDGAQWFAAPSAQDGPRVAFVDGFIALRNGADGESPVLIFDQDEWRAFQSGVRRGEFDDLT